MSVIVTDHGFTPDDWPDSPVSFESFNPRSRHAGRHRA